MQAVEGKLGGESWMGTHKDSSLMAYCAAGPCELNPVGILCGWALCPECEWPHGFTLTPMAGQALLSAAAMQAPPHL